MQLRRWQSEAITSALTKFRSGHQHFLCLATPGAGKTLMASMIARELLNTGEVDLVVCFSPSINVSTAFQASLETHTGGRFDGLMGSKGCALTYHSMLNLDETFWSLLIRYRVFVIFDEIHHCAGDHVGNTNAWGQRIIQHIQGRAAFTLALTGTPWRSDKVPIVLSSYCRQGKILCDYTYGLGHAIEDSVCRLPRITAVDNDQILLQNSQRQEKFSSFGDLLKQSRCTYQQLLANTTLIAHLVRLTDKKLNQIRHRHPDAGALIVAASVEHAVLIADILHKETGDHAWLATYVHDDAQEIINTFRKTKDKWIISVGMISEGTDIPRLRVCCHLTRVKTELYFRQVLGRILRSTEQPSDAGYLFMPAEPSLMEFAQRVAEDIPESNVATLEHIGMHSDSKSPLVLGDEPNAVEISPDTAVQVHLGSPTTPTNEALTPNSKPLGQPHPGLALSEAYDAAVGLFGKFRHQIFSLKALNN